MKFQVQGFADTAEARGAWDRFVLEESANGTFLQTRRFLGYHPPGRFEDCSLVVTDGKGTPAAVVPGCVFAEEGVRTFFSHRGSTFGGPVVRRKYYSSGPLAEILEAVLGHLKESGFGRVYLRPTSGLFARADAALLEYMLFYAGFSQYQELSTYIDFATYKPDILSNFAQGKRTNVHNCLRQGMGFGRIGTDEGVSRFYALLEGNLKKFGAAPVHTLEELYLLRDKVLPGEVSFWGVTMGEEMVAGAMLFLFAGTNALHTQYLAASPAYSSLSPMTFLCYNLIAEAARQARRYLSFGISTEERGRVLNFGLIKNKEYYGSSYSVNHTFYKEL